MIKKKKKRLNKIKGRLKNPRAKGNKVQHKCIKLLESWGCTVSKVEQHGKFVKEKDLFGLFDIIFINEKGGFGMVQVTCNRPHTHSKFQKFEQKFCKALRHIQILQMVWYDYKGWKVFTYKNGKKTVEKHT